MNHFQKKPDKPLPISYSTAVEYMTTLRQFCPRKSYRTYRKKLFGLRARWAARVGVLASHGWLLGNKMRVKKCMECFPCSLYRNNAWKCGSRFCLFCYARKMAWLYTRLATLVADNKDCRIVVIRRIRAGSKAGVDPASVIADYCRVMSIQRATLQKTFKKARGGLFQFVLSPRSELGRWYARSSLLVFLPAEAKMPGLSDSWDVKELPMRKGNLARAIGWAFKYPAGWFKAPPELVAPTFELLKRTRLSSTFGIFRKVNLDDLRTTVPTNGDQAAVGPERAADDPALGAE